MTLKGFTLLTASKRQIFKITSGIVLINTVPLVSLEIWQLSRGPKVQKL